MITPSPNFVSTDLGRLNVRRTGTGPPVVLWHSLFVDSRCWAPLVETLSRDRTVYAIDGPSHGKSEPCTVTSASGCVAAAQNPDSTASGLTEPIDWVVTREAMSDSPRDGLLVRTLTTIGTPVRRFAAEKLTAGRWSNVPVHRRQRLPQEAALRFAVGPETVAAQPDQAATVIASFAEADRDGMLHAMRSMMMHRSGVDGLLPRITIPTLVMSVRDDAMGWRPDEARRTCAAIPDCRVEEVAGGGHVAPLLLDRDRIAQLLTEFWAAAVPKASPVGAHCLCACNRRTRTSTDPCRVPTT
jgi:pimeloyl-ACP methyl ester carboxylesterase